MDPQTVRFTLNKAHAPFLSDLAYPTGLLVAAAAVEQHGGDFAAIRPHKHLTAS